MNRALRLLSLALVIALTGCAASVNRSGTQEAPLQTTATAPTKLVMTVSGSPAMEASDDWVAFCEEWQTSMTAATSAAQLGFAYTGSKNVNMADAATLVQVKVNDFRYVSQAKRYGLGVMTGNAFMDVDVDFIDLPSAQKLGARKFTTSSSAWQGVFSAMTPKQVEAVSAEIVRTVAKK
jgi:hypothetical protein|nr:DUF4410 domain-containing protein [uncultured Albidiferax sp.]